MGGRFALAGRATARCLERHMAPTTTTLEHRIAQPMSVRLLLIVPKDHATRLGALAEELADMPGCEVIVDRRQSEQRQADATWQGEDRRRNDRRSDRLERPDLRVLFVH
jgi:hypothetical protein